MGKDKALGGKDNKLLALLAIAVCIISVAPIFLHHSHDESTYPHKNVLKGSLDNFVEEKKSKSITIQKNDASGRDYAAEQQFIAPETKANTEEDSQIADPAVKSKSNTGEGGSINNNNSIDAAKSDPQKLNTANKKEETTNVKNENNKSYLRQKAKPSVGDSNSNNTIEHDLHPVANLNCADHGGPFDPHIVDEMVYWVRSYSCCKVSQ